MTPDAPTPKALLRSALWYARAALWYVIPLHTPLFDAAGQFTGCSCEAWKRTQERHGAAYVCPNPGKHPRLSAWEEKATRDEATIREWWRRWPNANVGIACGPSGLVVIDVDEDGALSDLVSREEQETVTALSGRPGGHHLYYQHPADGPQIGNSDVHLPPGVNVRGWGGQVAAPPSLHPYGRRYTWEPGYGPHDDES